MRDDDATAIVLMVKTALGPVLERLAAAEARLAVLGDLRDRVVTVEAKAAVPVLPLPPEAGIDDLRDRLVNLETKAAGPSLSDMGLTELRTQLATVQAKAFEVSERVAVVETIGPLPGQPGADGKDGLGFEDLDVSLSGDRTLVFRFARGDQEKTFPVVVGWPLYQKNWIQGKAYVPGDRVTWDGSEWQCLAATDVDLPGVSPVWYRVVTKGRAGAPGRDGKDWTPPPVVSVGRRE